MSSNFFAGAAHFGRQFLWVMTALVMTLFAASASAQLLRPQAPNVDFTRTAKIAGGITSDEIKENTFSCPFGQVLSGGQCTLIANHAPAAPAYDVSWTLLFVGQSRGNCDGRYNWGCAWINADGSFSFTDPFWGYITHHPRPTGLNVIHLSLLSSCPGASATAVPVQTLEEARKGLPPSDWGFSFNRGDCGGDGSSEY